MAFYLPVLLFKKYSLRALDPLNKPEDDQGGVYILTGWRNYTIAQC